MKRFRPHQKHQKAPKSTKKHQQVPKSTKKHQQAPKRTKAQKTHQTKAQKRNIYGRKSHLFAYLRFCAFCMSKKKKIEN